MDTVEEIKQLIMSGDARLDIGCCQYHIRLPCSSGRKGLYFVTVLVNGEWVYAGYFWRSTLHFLRGHKSELTWNDEQVKTFSRFLTSLRYGKLPDYITPHVHP
jgi:hypothetical protein